MKTFLSFQPIWLIQAKYDLAYSFKSGNLAPSSLVKPATQVLLSHVSPPFSSSQMILSQGSNPGLVPKAMASTTFINCTLPGGNITSVDYNSEINHILNIEDSTK